MYTEVRSDRSGSTSARCLFRSLEEGDKIYFEELYSDERNDIETSFFGSGFD